MVDTALSQSNSSRGRRWLLSVVAVIMIVELLWVLVANYFLAQPSTQAWLSNKRPDRVQIGWEKASSWYPGQFSVSGAQVSGQTARFQWQADARAASGNVALLPLARKEVVLRNVRVSGGEYRQRQRLRRDGSNQAVSQWFPPIRGYELTEVGERRKPKKKPWTVVIHDGRVSGDYSVWIHRFQAQLAASARVNLSVRSQGGPLALQVNQLAADFDRAWADQDEAIFSEGTVSGELTLGPYRYRDHRGRLALRFLETDLNIDLNTESFDFVRLFLLRYPSIQVDGSGRANGKLVLSEGRVANGTSIDVKANDLVFNQEPFRISGEGTVKLQGQDDAERPFLIGMLFSQLGIHHSDDDTLLVSGNNLSIGLADDGELLPRKMLDPPRPHEFSATVYLPDARVADARVFNRFLPENPPLEFTEGQADLTANLQFTPDKAGGTLKVEGQNLTARMEQQDIGLDLRFDATIDGGKPLDRRFDLTGSVLEFSRARVLGAEDNLDAEDWSARADFRQGEINLKQTREMHITADLTVSDSRPLSALFINHGGPRWIARRLTVDSLKGELQLQLDNKDLYVPTANLAAPELEFGFKGVIAKPDRQGMLYLRYKKLDALLNFQGTERDIVVIRALKKYQDYSVIVPTAD